MSRQLLASASHMDKMSAAGQFLTSGTGFSMPALGQRLTIGFRNQPKLDVQEADHFLVLLNQEIEARRQ